MKTLNVALIGQGFMGRTHSNAWGQVNKFFQPPVKPGHAHGVRPGGGESPGLRRQLGLADTRRPIGRASSNRPKSDWSTSSRRTSCTRRRPGPPSPPASPCSCEKPIAGTLADAREMAAGRQEGRRQDVRLVQLPPLSRRGLGPSAGQGRPDRRHPPRSGVLPAGLGRRIGAAGLAVRQEAGRLRRPRRPQRPHRRHDPIRHRPGDHRSGRRDRRDVHQEAQEDDRRRGRRDRGGLEGRATRWAT